jgi:hypothetical protein
MIDRLIEIGTCYGMEIKNTKLMIISRQLSLVQNIIDRKQLENVEYIKYFGITRRQMIQGAREIKSIISAVKSAFSKKTDFTSNLNLTLRKKLVKSYVWSIVLCGAETFDTLEIRSEITGKF